MQAWQEPFEDTATSALWSWRLRAACRNVDSAVFYPSDGERPPERDARETRAKAICGGCPVIGQCAAYAIRYGERYGIWGGLSERERDALALQPDRALAIIGTAGAAVGNGGRGLP
jgi:WhiB family transcriptional regulator, redox-sensing transcriptional regulator